MVSTRYPHSARIYNIIHSPFVVEKLHEINSILAQVRADADILRKIVYSLFADSHSKHSQISAYMFLAYTSSHQNTNKCRYIVAFSGRYNTYISVRYTLVQIGFTVLLMLVRYIVILHQPYFTFTYNRGGYTVRFNIDAGLGVRPRQKKVQ